MKFVLSCLLLFLAAVAQALSVTGDRLLSIWEDLEDQKQYSKFIGGLEGMLALRTLIEILCHLLITLRNSPRLQDQPCDSQTRGLEVGTPRGENI